MATSTVEPWGTLPDGSTVEAVILRDGSGLSASILTLGATLHSLWVPDARGDRADVVLGHDHPEDYLASRHYFGGTIGRSANRIAHGRFMIGDAVYQLECNDGPHHLHGGGNSAFHRRLWRIDAVDAAQVVMTLRSEDGEGGYPGNVAITASFSLRQAGQLEITYRARTDKPTIVNLTNHCYFNLSGGRSTALGATLRLHARQFASVQEGLIPTGHLCDVAGTPFDFRAARSIASRIRESHPQLQRARGYDHHFIIDGEPGLMRPAARLEDPVSGRWLELHVTAPGVQFYSGNFLDGTVAGKGGRYCRQGDGICLEPQGYPDAPNQPTFRATRVDPGDTYCNRMLLNFGAD